MSKNSLPKDREEFFFYLYYTRNIDTSFSRIEHLNFRKLLKYVNISTNIPQLESYNIVHF